MEALGWNISIVVQLINFAILLGWPVLAIVALRRIGELPLSAGARLGWAALAVLVPFLGALAVLLANPRRRQPNP